MKKAVILISTLVCSYFGYGQKDDSLRLFKNLIIELGTDRSFGTPKRRFIDGILNPYFQLTYYSNKRFVNPGIRLRLSKDFFQLGSFNIGLVSGLTIRTGERYSNITYAIKSMPIQIRVSSPNVSIKNSSLGFDLAGGVNVQKVTSDYWTSKTGPLYSVGFSFSVNPKFLIKGGAELQLDRGAYFVFANPSMDIKDEKFSYWERREVIYLSFGIKL